MVHGGLARQKFDAYECDESSDDGRRAASSRSLWVVVVVVNVVVALRRGRKRVRQAREDRSGQVSLLGRDEFDYKRTEIRS